VVKLNIGLTFPGTCEKAFTFYKSVFGGEFTFFIRYRDDSTTDATTPKKDKDKMAYVAMPLGDILLYGDDTLESSGINVVNGNNMSISVEPDNKNEADRVFKALAADGTVIIQIMDFPWGYCGILLDKFGVKWIVWYKPPKEE
jgi:PhnB protein